MSDFEKRALRLSTDLADALSAKRLDETLQSLTEAAVHTLPGVDHASITVRHQNGTIQSYAMTADFLEELDAGQYENQEGPCYDGVANNAFTVCGNLANDPRYPNYGPQALAAGVRSQAGLRLYEADKARAALNLYSRSVGALADIAFLAELFSQHARTAIRYAQEIDGLTEAITSRQLIGQAVGILMERYQLSDERAFAFLSRVSQDRNLKLRVVAQEVIDDTVSAR